MKNRKFAFVYQGFDIIKQKFEEQESGTFLLNIPELDRIHELHQCEFRGEFLKLALLKDEDTIWNNSSYLCAIELILWQK